MGRVGSRAWLLPRPLPRSHLRHQARCTTMVER
uniref:Uncharacterized protein n=1 Tax=Siphoviridae sp. ctGpg14 TaxID=2827824 RepID=A0A8S5T734_9CAUD|nr:MAG TPA: hypothetical protein [Siphoviridae sp. ctGpg14]